MDTALKGKASYLRARDPSIVAWGGMIPKVGNPCNLKKLLEEEESVLEPEKQKTPNQIEVYLRIKKCINAGFYEHVDDVLTCNIPQAQTTNSRQHLREGDQVRKKFTFSKIFPEDCIQMDIFNQVVKARVLDFINGNNNTLLTYGTSGSGKTYTIVGTATEPGIIPRTLEYVFKTITKLPKVPKSKLKSDGTSVSWLTESEGKKEMELLNDLINDPTNVSEKQQHIRTYKAMQQRLTDEPVANLEHLADVSLGIWVSFAEIYNEQIYDLLEWGEGKSRQKLKLCNNNGNTYIKNLKQVYVSQGIQAYQLLQFGLRNLKYAATSINSHSSRSHCIFVIKLVQASQHEDTICVSTFSLCDLAGSERSKKTNNVGDRLKESNNINNSLLVLGRCISTVRNSQKSLNKKRVPFRESKLTQLFQKALSGHEDISMIVNINPIKEMLEETIHALNFSAIAKDIVIVRPDVNKIDQDSKLVDEGESELVASLKHTISELYFALETEKLQSIKTDQDTRDHMLAEFQTIIDDVQHTCQEKLNLKDKKILELEKQLSGKRRRLNSDSDEEETSVIYLDDSMSEDSANLSRSLLERVVPEKVFEMKEYENMLKRNTELEKKLQDMQLQYEESEKQVYSITAKLIKLQEEADEADELDEIFTYPDYYEEETDTMSSEK